MKWTVVEFVFVSACFVPRSASYRVLWYIGVIRWGPRSFSWSWFIFATLQASFEVVVVSAKARGLPDGRPEVSIEENDFRDHIFGSAFLNVLYLCFSFILPHYVTKTYENKGEKNWITTNIYRLCYSKLLPSLNNRLCDEMVHVFGLLCIGSPKGFLNSVQVIRRVVLGIPHSLRTLNP